MKVDVDNLTPDDMAKAERLTNLLVKIMQLDELSQSAREELGTALRRHLRKALGVEYEKEKSQ